MSNLSSLASITCKLTPSTSNLVDAMAMASKQLFTMRSLHVWGRWYFESFRARAFVSDSLIGYEIDVRPIKNTVSLRCHSVVWCRDLSQLRDHWAFDMTTDRKLFCGRIGYIWLVKIITTIRQVKASESKDKLGAMTPSRAQEKIGKY